MSLDINESDQNVFGMVSGKHQNKARKDQLGADCAFPGKFTHGMMRGGEGRFDKDSLFNK